MVLLALVATAVWLVIDGSSGDPRDWLCIPGARAFNHQMQHAVAHCPVVEHISELRYNGCLVEYKDNSNQVRRFRIKALAGLDAGYGVFLDVGQPDIPAGICIGYVSGDLCHWVAMHDAYSWLVPGKPFGHHIEGVMVGSRNTTYLSLVNAPVPGDQYNLVAVSCASQPGATLIITTRTVRAGEQLGLSYNQDGTVPGLHLFVKFTAARDTTYYANLHGEVFLPDGTATTRYWASASSTANIRQLNAGPPDFDHPHPWLDPEQVRYGSPYLTDGITLQQFLTNPCGCVFHLDADPSLVYSPALRLVYNGNGTLIYPHGLRKAENLELSGVYFMTNRHTWDVFEAATLGYAVVA
jgi:hypothetical protein